MERKVRYLSRRDVERVCPSTTEMVQMLDEVFKQQAAGQTQMPPKPGIFASDSESWRAMLAYVPGLRVAGVKWVSVFGSNANRGLPQITALLIINDIETGFPKAILDGSLITARRTAAASALAARHLGRASARRLGIIGCGVQARTHAEALLASFPITDLFAYDIDASAAQQYIQEVSSRYDVAVHAVDSPRAAVESMDIVLSAGPILKTPLPTIRSDWLSQGSLVLSIDYVSHFDPNAFEVFDLISTDVQEQFDHYRSLGFFSAVPPFQCDLGQLVTGKHSGRTKDNETILACLLGAAIEDMAVAARVVEAAENSGIGQLVPL